MDQSESTTLASVLAQVPDPRKRRGRRHAWPLLWTLKWEVRISVGSTREERQDLPLVPIPLPATIEHQRAQGG
jgi:hypothetical protein